MASDEHTPNVPAGAELSPFDEEFRENPHPRLKALREHCPAHRDPEFNHVSISSEALVREKVRDHSLYVDPRKARDGDWVKNFEDPTNEREPSILFLDNPDHGRLRRMVAPEFTPRRAETRRLMVREIAEALVAAIEPNERGEFDLMMTLAGPLPALAIGRILGVPEEDAEDFKEWSEIASAGFFTGPLDPDLQAAGMSAGEKLEALFQREVQHRRETPADDLIGKMVRQQQEGAEFSDQEILTMCNLLLVAGNVTTSDLIGNGSRTLIEHPEQWDALRNDPDKMAGAIEEMLRFDPPVTVTGRITMTELPVGDQKLDERESMTILLSAANRDPALHDDPDRFDIERGDSEHFSFGGGAHFCLGAHLARLEAQEAIRALVARFPRLENVPGGARWKQVPGFRGMSEFRVRVV